MKSLSATPCVSRNRAYITVVVLFIINLLNYMDRFTVAGAYVNTIVSIARVHSVLTLRRRCANAVAWLRQDLPRLFVADFHPRQSV